MAARALEDGFYDVPPGRIAAVVTHLEMLAPPHGTSTAPSPGYAIRRVHAPSVDWYRDLYRRIGADWLWFSRLRLTEAELASILENADVAVFALSANGRDEGLLELDFHVPGECELAFFGLAAPLIGKGAGRALMDRAIQEAWSRPIRRFWVHTCTLDHPRALAFYQRAGFTPFRQQVEIARDPRLVGELPPTAAAHVPMIGCEQVAGKPAAATGV